MLVILRIAAILALFVIAGSVLLFLLTRERKYLRFAYAVFKCTMIAAAAFFAYLVLERVISAALES